MCPAVYIRVHLCLSECMQIDVVCGSILLEDKLGKLPYGRIKQKDS